MLTVNIYTGRSKDRKVIKINKNSITLEVTEFTTKQAKYYFRPSINRYFNEYLSEAIHQERK